MKYWNYFRYVLRHKYWVYVEGRKLGIPRWRLIIHDWDKFIPWMFAAYTKNFYGNEAERNDERVKARFKEAWKAHCRRNKHHWDYWKGEVIPMEHSLELVADWKAMGHSGLSAREWYEKNKDRIVLHPIVRGFVEPMLE